MKNSIIFSPNVSDDKIPKQKLGGKGKNLFYLSKKGYPVPLWFCVTSDVFTQTIKQLLNQIDFSQPEILKTVAKKLRQLILSQPFPKQFSEQLNNAYVQLSDEGKKYVAIRSSGTSEDALRFSFAGQFESFLFIGNFNQVVESIKKCWASAFSEHALVYINHAHIALENIAMAVIIQEMVKPDVSGVMFTEFIRPSQKHAYISIAANYGVGIGVVTGNSNVDTYSVDKKSLFTVESDIQEKTTYFTFDQKRGHGVIQKEVPQEIRRMPTLNSSQIEQLAKLGLQIEKDFAFPQDVEWAIQNGKIYILQTRPITTYIKKHEKDLERLWDNSNIVESYSGITTPLTFSFARRAYTVVYKQAAQLLGANEKKLLENENIFQNMIGYLHGRIYYNLYSWYHLLSLMPGFRLNKQFMEQMMGVKEKLPTQIAKPKEGTLFEKTFSAVVIPFVLGRILYHFFSLSRFVKQFLTRFKKIYREYKEVKLGELTPDEIGELYQELEYKFLYHWKVPIMNDIATMIFYGTLKKLTQIWKLDEHGALANNLLCGIEEEVSNNMTGALFRLSQIAKTYPALIELINNPQSSFDDISQRSKSFPEVHRLLVDYLERFGERSPYELKLETKNLKEDPSFFCNVIKTYMKLDSNALIKQKIKRNKIRLEAERKAEEKLRRKKILGFIPVKPFYFWILSQTRIAVLNRERMRLARAKTFSLARNIFNSLGEKFYTQGIINKADDIFFLEVEEIFRYIQGTATVTNLQELVELRKKESAQYEKENIPSRLTTHGIVYFDLSTLFENKEDEVVYKSNILHGIGASPGIAEGHTCIMEVLDSKKDVKGKILVASNTDPGWTPLFLVINGLVVERGSLLSHSAIVAREFGVPCVVSVTDATSIIKNDQTIKVDGSKGHVEIL